MPPPPSPPPSPSPSPAEDEEDRERDVGELDPALVAALDRAGIKPSALSFHAACRELALDRPAFLRALRDRHGVTSLSARQGLANALSAARRAGRVPGVRPPRMAGTLPDTCAFCTYGDHNYAAQKERIAQQAERTGWFAGPASIRCYGRTDAERLAASSAAALDVLNLPRGGGYWLWKPLIIQDALSQLADGSVLLYADAGSSLYPSETADWHAKLRELSDTRPIDAARLTGRTIDGKKVNNGAWCRADTAQAVLGGAGASSTGGVRRVTLENFYVAEQIEANRVLILACDASRQLVDEWARLALALPQLFTDAPSAVPNELGFHEHRHDQAIFSALMYRHGWSGSVEWRCAVATRIRTESMQYWEGQGR